MWRRRELLTLAATALVRPRRAPPRRVLILGGTRWIGPHVVDLLLARGHTPTLFNRGKTAPDRFPGLDQLRGDRAGDLAELADRRWDDVLDLSSFRPAWVRRSAQFLAGSIDRYVLMSSTAVYARYDLDPTDETLPLRPLERAREDDATAEYGARKAGCERAAADELPGRVCALRASYVVGPADPTPRAAAWLAHASRGGQVPVPGRPEDALLYLDVRDLAAFVVRMIEGHALGAYNVTQRCSLAAWAEACRAACGAAPTFKWGAPAPAAAMVHAPRGLLRRWGELDTRRALAEGLDLRSPARTLADTWAALRDDPAALARATRAWDDQPGLT